VDPSYAQRYRELAVRHWWWRARNECVRSVVRQLLDRRHDAAILDIGCGDGVLFPFLSEFGQLQGIEPDPTVVSDDSPWRDRIRIQPFDESFNPGRRYDLILMLDVLEHFEDPLRTLKHVARLLGDGGRVLVTVPAFKLLWTHHDDLNRHFHRFTKRQLSNVVGAAGLEVMESWYLFHWLFAAKLVQRAKERITGPPPPEEVPADRINEALYRLCTAEQRVAGRHVPFGSSVIAVIK
jgi:2-polyprenyl-3-methyl-5-hydroxy-6-metoxy-1,4-benzoquinol methylase